MDESNSFRRGGSPEQGQVIRLRQASSVRASAADEVRGDEPAADTDLSASDLFAILWRELVDVLGTAAGATLLRRAAQRAVLRWPELAGLAITRERLEYRYSLPDTWRDPSRGPPQALCGLARELCTLLVDLTGSVIVNRLAQVPELRIRGIIPELTIVQPEVPS